MSFRQYGGINYAARNNIVKNNYTNANNLNVMTKVGQPDSIINVDSGLYGLGGNITFQQTGVPNYGIMFSDGSFQNQAVTSTDSYWAKYNTTNKIYYTDTVLVGINPTSVFPDIPSDISFATSGNVFISGNLKVGNINAGVASINFFVDGSTGATTLGSTLGVSGATNLGSTLGVIGATNLGSGLNVTGATTLGSTLSVGSNTTLNGNLSVFGSTNISNLTAAATTVTSLSASTTLGVTGATTLSSGLTVTSGATTLGGLLDVTSGATIGGSLGVTGDTTLDGSLTVTGATTLGSSLSVTTGSTNVQVTDSDMRLNGVYPPPDDNSVVTKKYVDNISLGFQIKQACQCATSDTDGNLSEITDSQDGPFSTIITTIDGYTLSDNDRILVKNQTVQTQNGIFVYNTSPNVTLSRASDLLYLDSATNVLVFVQYGTDNDKTSFLQNTIPSIITVGVDNLIFAQFSQFQVSTGDNLTFTSGELNVNPVLSSMTSIQFGSGIPQTVPFVALSPSPLGNYTNANITVNSFGQITSAVSTPSGGASEWTLASGSLYPNSTSTNVAIGTNNADSNRLLVQGNLKVNNGTTTLGGALNVTSGLTTLNNGLAVSGSTTLNTGLTVSSGLIVNNGGLTISNGGLSVNGTATTTLNTGLTVTSGALTVSSGIATNLNGTLGVSGATNLSSTLNVTGTITGNLSGNATSSTEVFVTADLYGEDYLLPTINNTASSGLGENRKLNCLTGGPTYNYGTGIFKSPNLTVSGTTSSAVLNVSGTTSLAVLNVSGTTSFSNTVNMNTSNGTIASFNLIPAGMIMAGVLNNTPAGWFLCDGAAYSRTTFSILFAAIGTTFGAGNGSTSFNVPNYQAAFLRGKGAASVSSIYSSSNSFNVPQNDGVKNHTHTINDPGHVHTYSKSGAELATGDSNPRGSDVYTTTDTTRSTTGITLNTNNNNTTENLVYNFAVNYYIKY